MSNVIDLRKIKKEQEAGDEVNTVVNGSTSLTTGKVNNDENDRKQGENRKWPTFAQASAGKKMEDSDDKDDERKEKGGFWEFAVELAKVVVISLAIVLPVRYFLIQPFYVKGASMEPSFYDHEYLIINEIGYRIGEPERGEIIVFKYPRQPDQYFIKRIVGLPGERVVISDGEVTIYNEENRDGKVLDESAYLLPSEVTLGEIDITLKEDEFYVVGDNRTHSLDSRSFGPVPRKNIIGKTWLRGWPLDRLREFGRPEYNF